MNSHTYPIKKKQNKKTHYACVPHPLLDKIYNDKVGLNTENMVKKGRTKHINIYMHLHLNACISLNLIFGQSVF